MADLTQDPTAVEPVPPNRLVNFFRRHDRILTLVGALIVFSTFMVKEGIREHLKDLIDALDAAQAIFVMERATQDLARDLETVSLGVREIQEATLLPDLAKTYKQRAHLRAFTEMASKLEGALDTQNRMLGEFDAIDRLLQRLPTSNEMSANLAELRRQRATSELSIKLDRMVALNGSLDKQMLIVGQVELDTAKLEAGTGGLAAAIFDSAIIRRDQLERRYRIATNGSYILYCIGWAVALAGKVSGIDVTSDAD
jgi:hypothetical protein